MNHSRALLMAHAAVFFMGIAGVLAEASGFEPWQSTSYRVTFGGAVLVGVWVWRRRRDPKLQLPTLRWSLVFLMLGVVLSVHWFTFFLSLKYLGVMLGSAMIGLGPLLVALGAALFLGESLSRRTRIAMIVSLVGFGLLGTGDNATGSNLVLGLAWSVFSFAIFAGLVLVNRIWVRDGSALSLTTLEMLGAIPLALMMTSGPWWPSGIGDWAYALGLGLLCTGLAYALFNASMKRLGAPVAGLLLSLEVVYGILGGWIIGDSLSPRQIVAALLIANILVFDLWFFWRSRKAPSMAT